MSVDRNNRAHRPGGLPQGYAGTFAPMRAGGAGDVVPPPPARRRARARGVEDDARAWGLKDRIESLADLGDGEPARRLAHEAGALCAGDSIPFADGAYAALFDGRELTTVRIDGPDIQDVGFRPESIRA